MWPSSEQDTVLVYNRVPKAGSTFMTELLHDLSKKQNHFNLAFATTEVRPGGEELPRLLRDLPNGTAWVRHAGFWDAAPAHFAWINIVRDPLERFRSLYDMYAATGLSKPSHRQSVKEIQRNYAALANDAACGCWNTSFNACITTSVERNCSLCIPSQIAFFCPPDDVDGVDSGHGNFRLCDVPRPNCTVQKALHRLRTRYKAVGLEEQMHASVELFEHLLPRFFAGATARAASMTARSNPLPMGTRSSGVSQSVRALLMGAGNFAAEQLFYHAAKLEFVKALREAQLPQTT